jgi:hypothetical protein
MLPSFTKRSFLSGGCKQTNRLLTVPEQSAFFEFSFVTFIQLFNQVTGEGRTFKTEINRLYCQAIFDLTVLAMLKFGRTRRIAAHARFSLP